MEKTTLFTILKVVGIVIGVLTAIYFVKQHPIIVILLVVGAGLYFFNQIYKKYIQK